MRTASPSPWTACGGALFLGLLLPCVGVGACAQISGVDGLTLCSGHCDVEGGSSGAAFMGNQGQPSGEDAPATVATDDGPAGALDSRRDDPGQVAAVPDATGSLDAPGAPGATEGQADGSSPTDAHAPADASDSSSSPCGPTNTAANCGACARSCDTTHSQSAACSAGACTYGTCSSGWSNCDKTAPDTAGCECNTPACCGSSCQTTHTSGVGQTFYDCTAQGTYSLAQAMEACAAFTGSSSQCMDAPAGVCGSSRSVCTSGASQCYCWQYAGTYSGTVEHQTGAICPSGCPLGNGTAWQ